MDEQRVTRREKPFRDHARFPQLSMRGENFPANFSLRRQNFLPGEAGFIKLPRPRCPQFPPNIMPYRGRVPCGANVIWPAIV